MNLFRKKMKATQEILQEAMDRISGDVDKLNFQRDEALGIFNQAKCRLENINQEIDQSVQKFREIAEFATKQAAIAEKTMQANTHVCEQICAIIGE